MQPIEGNNYAALNSGQGGSDEPPNSALWKSRNQDFKTGNLVKRSLARVVSIWTSVTDRSTWTLPIKGFTLVRLWWITQFVFAGAMAATWFVTTVQGAYFVIGVTGICWALAQCESRHGSQQRIQELTIRGSLFPGQLCCPVVVFLL